MQETTVIIDRKDEIETVRDHIRQGKSLHIYGPEGVGKSALLDYVCDTWNEIGTSRTPVYCKDSGTLEQILDTIAKFLLGQGKKLVDIDYERRTEKLILQLEDLATVPRRNLRNMVFPHIKRGDYCIILDHLKNVTPRTNSLLKALYECTSVVTASRQSWDKTNMTSPYLHEYDLWLIQKLKIENFDKENAFSLIESLLNKKAKTYGVRRLYEDIYEVTQGNPKMINKIIAEATDQHRYDRPKR